MDPTQKEPNHGLITLQVRRENFKPPHHFPLATHNKNPHNVQLEGEEEEEAGTFFIHLILRELIWQERLLVLKGGGLDNL